MSEKSAEERIAAIEERRRARRAKLEAEEAEQHAADLEAVDALEEQHGDNSITVLHVPFTSGQPTLVAARAPKKIEIKRYRARIEPKSNGKPGNPVDAAEELGAVCLVYPSKEVFEAMLETRPGLQLQLGVAAANLAAGRQADEGKG